MPGVHKNPTISFHISDYERREIEAKIKASRMMKKDYFIRSCIYNYVCCWQERDCVCIDRGIAENATKSSAAA